MGTTPECILPDDQPPCCRLTAVILQRSLSGR
jgi:hypothetical protein